MNPSIKALRDWLGLLILGAVGFGFLLEANVLWFFPQQTGWPDSLLRITLSYLLYLVPTAVALFISLWIFHRSPTRASWKRILLTSLIWIPVLPVVTFVYLIIVSFFRSFEGEAGMAFLILPIYAAGLALQLILPIIAIGALVRLYAPWWKWVWSAAVILSLAWIVILIPNGLCSYTNGECTGKKFVKKGLLATECAAVSDYRGCLKAYAVETKNPSVCSLTAAEYARRCAITNPWHVEKGWCFANGVDAGNATNSCLIDYGRALRDLSVCKLAKVESNNRYTCCSFVAESMGKSLNDETYAACGLTPGDIERGRW